MSSWRRRLVAALADELGTARGEARLLAERTAAAAERSSAEADRAIDAAARKQTKLAAIHRRMTTTLQARKDNTLRSAVNAAQRAAALAAPAAAGAPWEDWVPNPALEKGPVPLLRVGTVDDEAVLPALVGLLDRAHLCIDTGAAVALQGLLLRAVGSVPAGSVRLHVYDPEHLGGALSPFAPLGEAGLLSFIGPSGLRQVLDALVEDVRRVNADVLAGDHATLAELAAATGRRPEPWRLLVLLDSDIATWPAHEQAQLTRLRRTGIGAGVHLVIVGDRIDGLPLLTATDYSHLPGAAVRLDPAPPTRTVTEAAKAIADGREPARLLDTVPPHPPGTPGCGAAATSTAPHRSSSPTAQPKPCPDQMPSSTAP